MICQNIPKRIGSRSSIQNVLNQAVDLGFFIKNESFIDRRVKHYHLSSGYVEMINKWADGLEVNSLDLNAA